jgi:hypothetical protein
VRGADWFFLVVAVLAAAAALAACQYARALQGSTDLLIRAVLKLIDGHDRERL